MFGPAQLIRTLHYLDFNDRLVDEIKDHRNFHCLFYDFCLKIAAEKKWRSFTCKYCPHFCLDPDSFLETITIQ